MPRVAVRANAILQWAGGEGRGTTSDVSLVGCSLVMAEDVAPGTPVRLTLDMPNCPTVALEGEIARRDADGVAVAFSIASQDRFVPYLFAHRFGSHATEYLIREEVPPRMASNLYLIGCPARFTTSQIISLVAPCGGVETASIQRLPEGPIATIIMDSPASARIVHQTFHGQLVGGDPLFIYLSGSRAAETLRLVLQQTALERFATTQRSLARG